ncbi:MAG: DegT/DnrJ/EryC1/StrS family aminotransferase [Candidatus Sungbacteria bacterium]|nr:DegT/DnrJ/EryC1/StrS family aminotransferase [Candidatus Sungbacteria bacterium]
MKTGWKSYEYVEKFQPEFAAYHGRKFGIMTPNCTQAIHLLLLALGVKEGDEVIIPECTWTGSSAPITYVRATPVFADIEEKNWCLDPASVEKRITPKTKAIIAVDLYGNMPDMDALEAIAKKHGIPLIEDSAEALGSTYKGKRAGSFGVGSVFSFHRTKTLTTGEGGMLLLDDPKLYERAMFLRDHGRHATIPYFVVEATPKYMPFNIQAAIGYAQFQRLPELIARKREILMKYKKHFAGVPDVALNEESAVVSNGAWATSLVVGTSYGLAKQQIMDELKSRGFPARPFFYPLSFLPAYAPYGTGSPALNPVAYSVSSRGITLPASYDLTGEQIGRYSGALKEILAAHRA